MLAQPTGPVPVATAAAPLAGPVAVAIARSSTGTSAAVLVIIARPLLPVGLAAERSHTPPGTRVMSLPDLPTVNARLRSSMMWLRGQRGAGMKARRELARLL